MKKYIDGKSLLVLAGIFTIMLLLNHLMPLHRDDYDYSLIWLTTEPINSLADVINSCYRHYLYHGGRMVTVFGLVTSLYLGKTFFDIVNALIFTAAIALMYFHAERRLTLKNPLALAALALLTWLSLPHFAEVAIWKSGSTVYLWSAFLALIFLLPYNLYNKNPQKITKLAALPMFLLGILAGWSVENLAVTVVFIASLISLYQRVRRHNMPLWMPAGAFGATIGLIGIVAAPGNFVRYDEQGGDRSLLLTILDHIGKQFAAGGEMLLYILPVILLLITALRLYRLRLLSKTNLKIAPIVQKQSTYGAYVSIILIALLMLSYFNGGFIAQFILDGIYFGLLTPLGLTDAKTTAHLYNLKKGFEEMFIYWGIIIILYLRLKKTLGLTADTISLANTIPMRDVLKSFPKARYAAWLIIIAVFNHLVMLAAPTFPARSTFSSVVMILIAVTAVAGDKIILKPLLKAKKLLLRGGAVLAAFTIIASIIITYQMNLENAARLEIIETAVKNNEPIAYMPPILNKNRMLRHVYFEDFDNSVTKNGVCHYYGLEDIIVTDKN